MTRTAPVALLLAAFLAGCPAPSQPAATGGKTATASKAAPKPAAKAETLTGTAMAPAGIVAAGGGNLVAAGGGNVISHNGGAIVAAEAGNYALLAVEERPLADAGVWLVPAGAKAELPQGDPVTTTDADGRFSLPVKGKSATGAYAVVIGAKDADGKPALLETLVAGGGKADVSAASTLAASGVRKDRGGDLEGFDRAAFDGLVGDVAARLTAGDLPDFTDLAAIEGGWTAFVGKVPEIAERAKALASEWEARAKGAADAAKDFADDFGIKL